MKKNKSLKTLLEKEFKTVPLNELWKSVLGEPEVNFTTIIYGPPGSGKTTFSLRLSHYLSTIGKVYYNSVEQGFSKSFKDQVVNAGLANVSESRFMIGDRDSFEDMMTKISTTKPHYIIIDSLQYIDLTIAQYKELIERFPRKAFVIISQGTTQAPEGKVGKALEFMVDIKISVNAGVVATRSRYGATKDMRLWVPASKPTPLFN